MGSMRCVLVLSFDPKHASHAQSIAPEDSWDIDSHQCQLIRLCHSKCQATRAQSSVLPASAGDPLGSAIAYAAPSAAHTYVHTAGVPSAESPTWYTWPYCNSYGSIGGVTQQRDGFLGMQERCRQAYSHMTRPDLRSLESPFFSCGGAMLLILTWRPEIRNWFPDW